MDKLIELLSDCCPHVDFSKETNLLTDKIIDSMDLVEIIMKLQDYYKIKIDFSFITPEHFDSAELIYKMISEYTNCGA